MKNKFKHELKLWSIYLATIVLAIYIHEIGHCIPAWIRGFWAIPTPAKEYISADISTDLYQYVALGGVLGSIIISLIFIFLYQFKVFRYESAILAGIISIPGFYSLQFLLIGGRPDIEFNAAQSALGFEYSGNMLYWIFMLIFTYGTFLWYIKSKPSYKIIGRIFIGIIVTIIFFVGIQTVNNAIFDPIFQSKSFMPK
jgi:hypothetical protein